MVDEPSVFEPLKFYCIKWEALSVYKLQGDISLFLNSVFPLAATAQVQISIADKNDNPPYFTQSSWSAQVPEQRPDDVGRIVTVSAMDKDEGNILY